ncbi:MAG: FtsQ-type POTRA domain-containing protein [Oscillospiraceae bacterium]
MRDVVKTPQNAGREPVPVRKKRRRNMSLYYLLIFAFVGVALVVLSMTVLFNTATVRINGVTLYSEAQIKAVAGADVGDNLLRLRTDIMEQRLVNTLPFVESATVKKHFLSSTLEINITQAVPSSLIEQDGNYYLISKNGRILEGEQDAAKLDIPIVEGFELTSVTVGQKLASDDPLKTKILADIQSVLTDIGLDKIRSIDLSDRTDIRLNYDDRVTVRIGSSVDLDYKLTSIQQVINKLGDAFEGLIQYNSAKSGITVLSKDMLEEQNAVDDSRTAETGTTNQTESG